MEIVMLFNTWQFAVFLPIVFTIYWLIPYKYRWAWLLVASYYFYMCWNVKYVVLIFFTTIVSYLCALALQKTQEIKKKKKILLISAILCLGVLFIFKYFNFFSGIANSLMILFNSNCRLITLNLLLPVGISFYTFQTLSYVIDVYRGDIEAERHFGLYAMYISFFPQLVAGPIERAGNLLPQFKEKRTFSYEKATYGMKLIAWGLFKKMLIADLLAVYVDKVFTNAYDFSGFSIVIALVFFSFQIYCDFSGYSDMAVGIAKLFGIDLMNNFKSPYFSESIKEFWSRWHISLSSWFKDYVYIPLGGNRVGKKKTYRNLLITFLLSGLWHGANFTYIVWGGLHGLLQIIERVFGINRKQKTAYRFIRVVINFAIVVLIWCFFRAGSIGEAIYMISHMFIGIGNPLQYIRSGYIALEITSTDFLVLLLPIVALTIYDFASLKTDVIQWISNKNILLRWIVYLLFVDWILIYLQYIIGSQNVAQKFIYFDF